MAQGMARNSTADLPEFVRGVASVLALLPGIALLCDARGQIVFGNERYRAEGGTVDGTPDTALPTVPEPVLKDALGTDQPAYHSLLLPSGRRTGVSCQRILAPEGVGTYVLIREEGRQAVVAKFVAAQEGLMRSRIERDRARAAEQRHKAEASHWRMMSMSDRLTGLHNAQGFRDRVSAALPVHECGVLVYADLNGFKMVNDSLGHSAGDDLLQDIGQALQATIRAGDIAGRLGGDEFAVFLPDCPAEELSKVVARLRKAMTRRIPVSRGGGHPAQILSVTPALGTAIYPDDHVGLEDLLHLADARMYAEKSAARQRRGGARA